MGQTSSELNGYDSHYPCCVSLKDPSKRQKIGVIDPSQYVDRGSIMSDSYTVAKKMPRPPRDPGSPRLPRARGRAGASDAHSVAGESDASSDKDIPWRRSGSGRGSPRPRRSPDSRRSQDSTRSPSPCGEGGRRDKRIFSNSPTSSPEKKQTAFKNRLLDFLGNDIGIQEPDRVFSKQDRIWEIQRAVAVKAAAVEERDLNKVEFWSHTCYTIPGVHRRPSPLEVGTSRSFSTDRAIGG
mmetsp:Transcript_3574/g.10359  ORF Transcript_3574/g.10359 Transcript_3574/m.10359 type:complete len:239 (-) Transcript_3574:153-869(-)